METEHSKLFEVLRKSSLFRAEAQTFREVTGLPLLLVPSCPRSERDCQTPAVGGVAHAENAPLSERELRAYWRRTAKRSLGIPCWRCLLQALATVNWGSKTQEPSLNGQRVVHCREGLAAVTAPVWVDGWQVATLAGGWAWLGEGSPAFSRQRGRSKHSRRTAQCPVGGAARAEGTKAQAACLRGASRAPSSVERGSSNGDLVAQSSHLAFHGAGRWVSRLAAELGEHLPALLLHSGRAEPSAVAKAKAYVEENLARALHTADVSQRVGLCETHFCRVFKEATGFTFSDYVVHRRIEEAKRLLRADTARRVREVAVAVGFQTVSHFNHVFRRLVGSSPTAWRSSAPNSGMSGAEC